MIHAHALQIIGSRESQQDSVGNLNLSHHRQLFVLADGMGGHQGGEIASQTIVQTFLAYFSHPIEDEPASEALHTALVRSNSALQQIITQQPELTGMGSTLLAVLINDLTGQFDYISVGDSPLYHHSATGSLKRINANHSFANDLANMVNAGVISAEEAHTHPQRHAITSAVTGSQIAKIDQNSGSLQHGERLLLASDGVHTLPDTQIGELMVNAPVSTSTAALLHAVQAQQLPYQDNTSVILLEYADHAAAPQGIHKIESPATIAEPSDFRQPEIESPATIAELSDFRQPEKVVRHSSSIKWLVLGLFLAAMVVGVGAIRLLSADERKPHIEHLPSAPPAAASQASEPIPVVQAASSASAP